MGEQPLSQDEQDQLVVDLTVNLDSPGDLGGPGDEGWDKLYNQLDIDHQIEVNDAIRGFADDAVGDEHWDSDN